MIRFPIDETDTGSRCEPIGFRPLYWCRSRSDVSVSERVLIV
ncbi:hypothetical protein C485_06390 [Natrinema altunense JCM 12890]|uniref:Uncharacterized protein n=1 Tax=Natrinema altunense (strain JCM 12890 / CGMCC 1.3731 / AJ2) TaxID=1227494 RepID=L9ZQ03_NATA2|nr:hypothetical protein C485_06390 [Natrinema altunense JCM 12890]